MGHVGASQVDISSYDTQNKSSVMERPWLPLTCLLISHRTRINTTEGHGIDNMTNTTAFLYKIRSPVGLLHATSGGRGLAGRLGGKLLAGGLASSGLTGGLDTRGKVATGETSWGWVISFMRHNRADRRRKTPRFLLV